MKSRFRRIRLAVYSLKRVHSLTLTVVRPTNTTNFATGAKTSVEERIVVKRASPLPVKTKREATHYIQNQKFDYGGYFDSKERVFLVSRRDLPKNFTLNLNDLVEVGNKKYTFTMEEFEEAEAVLFVCTAVESPVLNQGIQDDVGVSDGSAGAL